MNELQVISDISQGPSGDDQLTAGCFIITRCGAIVAESVVNLSHFGPMNTTSAELLCLALGVESCQHTMHVIAYTDVEHALPVLRGIRPKTHWEKNSVGMQRLLASAAAFASLKFELVDRGSPLYRRAHKLAVKFLRELLKRPQP